MSDIKKTVLVIEDERPLLDSYVEILEGADYEALSAEDGYKGLEKLSEHKDSVDILLLDLMMPGMDGLEVLRSIKNDPDKYGNHPVIVLTNMTSERVIKEAFIIGADSYLIKTELDTEDLTKEIEKVLGTK
jgi:CheY-like chemotaxis protein